MIPSSARTVRRRTGFSILDVAVALTLTAFAFMGVAVFMVRLTDASNTSTARAAARRAAQIAEMRLEGDFAALTACGTGLHAAVVAGINSPKAGGDEAFSLFVTNPSGGVDLVSWRINGGALQRGVVSGSSGSCEDLDPAEASWETVLDSAGGLSAEDPFVPYRNGNATLINSDCVGEDASRCRIDAVNVALSTEVGDKSGPVHIDRIYDVPRPELY